MPKKHMISVTTKGGDGGESGLANGMRLSKADIHFEVVGNLDELNSWLGLIVVKLQQASDSSPDLSDFAEHRMYLREVQDTLFYIGAEVAQSPKARLKKDSLEKLEKNAEKLQADLVDNWHTRFVLPGGTEIGAWLDIARTVCRRTERSLVQLQLHRKELNPILAKYLNRLSDYLYILRCYTNDALGYDEQEFEAN